MSKRKHKTYSTAPSKPSGKNIVIKVKSDNIHSRNIMHFEHQLKTRMQIVESKKHKPSRYPHKIEDFN